MSDHLNSETMQNLLELVNERKYAEARTIILEQNVVDLAEAIEEVEDNANVLLIFRLMPKEMSAEVFAYLESDVQQRVVEGITDRELGHIMDELFLDDTIDFIEEMPANIVKRVLKVADHETRQHINLLLKYPDDSAGSLMTIEMMELDKSYTVKEAIEAIRKQSEDKESLSTCFVTTRGRKLEGAVTLHTILASRDDEIIENIMDGDVISVGTNEDQSEIANLFKKYDFLSMPVVDNENRLVGLITIDDIVDVIEDENTEDIYRMGAVVPDDEDYIKSNIWTLAKGRILWLLVLMVSSTISSSIIRGYEAALLSVVVLNAYIPMLMGTGGNAGSQSSTMVIRGISLNEIKFSDLFKIVKKELGVGLICGGVLAVINFFKLIFFDKLTPLVAVTISCTLLFTVLLAKLCGGALPIIAKKLHVDPAIMAAPIITTIVDAMSLIIYFSIATLLLL